MLQLYRVHVKGKEKARRESFRDIWMNDSYESI